MIYRDLLYPKIINNKKVFYNSPVFYFFYNFFIPNFKKILQKTGENTKNIIVKKVDDGFFLTTSSVIHREIQRHYITFRDFCHRNGGIQNITGIQIMDHFFQDIKAGQKIFLVKIKYNNNNLKLIKKYDLKKCKRLNNKNTENKFIYKINSEVFDLFYDDILLYLLSRKDKQFYDKIKIWQKREGKERYLYADFLAMLELGIDSGKDYILFPENSSSLKTVQRNYYNRYLEKNIDLPEKDGKQIIVFKKMTIKNAIIILENLREDNTHNFFKDINKFYLLKNKLNDKLKKG